MWPGSDAHTLPGLAETSSSEMSFHVFGASMRKGSSICQTRGALNRVNQPPVGFERLRSVYFYSYVFFTFVPVFSVLQEQTEGPSGCSGMKGRPPGREGQTVGDPVMLLTGFPSAGPPTCFPGARGTQASLGHGPESSTKRKRRRRRALINTVGGSDLG